MTDVLDAYQPDRRPGSIQGGVRAADARAGLQREVTDEQWGQTDHPAQFALDRSPQASGTAEILLDVRIHRSHQ